MKSVVVVASVFVLFCAGQLRAQEELDHHTEIGISGIGAFTSERSGQGIDQKATDTGGVLASLRFLFTAHQGVEIDYSHAQFSQEYLSPVLGINSRIHTDLDEFTASYVVRFPVRRVVPYLSAGAGAVLFIPSRSRAFVRQPSQTPYATFVYGAGMDIKCTDWLVFRFGYRGLVYSAPDFGIPALNVRTGTNLAEPMGGFALTF